MLACRQVSRPGRRAGARTATGTGSGMRCWPSCSGSASAAWRPCSGTGPGPPFADCWSLPGGPLGERERLGASPGRHLAVKVDLTDIEHLEQLETRSDPDRDPQERVLATAYLALVATDVSPRTPPDTAWHPVSSLPRTALDHESIIGSARERLRAKQPSHSRISYPIHHSRGHELTRERLAGVPSPTLPEPDTRRPGTVATLRDGADLYLPD